MRNSRAVQRALQWASMWCARAAVVLVVLRAFQLLTGQYPTPVHLAVASLLLLAARAAWSIIMLYLP